jgi:hypothetical protein
MEERGRIYDLNVYRKKEAKDVWITATINLTPAPTTGWILLDWVMEFFFPSSRYTLKISEVTDTARGKQINDVQVYHFSNSAQVKVQIHWELGRVCGKGYFAYRNNTGEPSELFVDLEWTLPNNE